MSLQVPKDKLQLLLNEDVPGWNAWKEEQTESIHLGSLDLTGKYLHGINLRDTVFEEFSCLEDANLTSADLFRATLKNCHCPNAIFQEADLTKAVLQNATLVKANFTNATLNGADLSATVLTDATFDSSDLRGANLCASELTETRFETCDLSCSRLRESTLDDAVFVSCNLSNSDVTMSSCQKTLFSQSNLMGMRFHNADCTSATFENVLIKDADFNSADLSNAELPDTLNAFSDGMKNIEEASRNTRGILYFMVGLSIFTLLSLANTTDAQLILGTSRLKLPIFGAEVPTLLFNFGAAFTSLFVFVYFHLHAHKIVEILRDMPARFPDRLTLGQKMYPWLLNDAFEFWRRDYWAQQEGQRKIKESGRFKASVAVFATYCLMPLTVFAIFIRTLPVRQWLVLVSLFVLVLTALGFSVYHYYSSKLQVCKGGGRISPGVLGVLRVAGLVAYCGLAFFLLAQNLWFSDSSAGCNRWKKVKTLIPVCWGQPDFSSQQLSTLKQQAQYRETYQDDGQRVYHRMAEERWEGVDLSGRDLQGADFRKAILPKANFEHALLKGANFSDANLAGANFQMADLEGSIMVNTTLTKTSFYKTSLTHATIILSNLSRARFHFVSSRDFFCVWNKFNGVIFNQSRLCDAVFAADGNTIIKRLTQTHKNTRDLSASRLQAAYTAYKFRGDRKDDILDEVETAGALLKNFRTVWWPKSVYSDKTIFPKGFEPQKHGLIKARPGTACEAPKDQPKNTDSPQGPAIAAPQHDAKPDTAEPKAATPESTTSIATPPPGG